MRYWEELYRRLSRSVRTHRAESNFLKLTSRRKSLRAFADPSSLLDFVHDRVSQTGSTDALYADLVSEVQENGPQFELAMNLLWVGLWPGLDTAYHKNLRFFVGREDELVASIADHFLSQVRRANLIAIRRVASTLTLNTRRDVTRACGKEWDHQRQNDPLVEGKTRSTFPDPVQEALAGELQRRIFEAAGTDAEIIILVKIHGFTVKEAATRIGISHEAAKKRLQRGLRRLPIHS